MIYGGKITEKKSEFSLNGNKEDLFGFYYIDNYNNIFNDLVVEIDEKGKILIGTINKEIKGLDLLFVLNEQITSPSLFKVSFEYNHIYIGDKEGNLNILSFDISKEKAKVTKIFSTSLTNNSQNIFTNIFTRNFPYKINDIWYNPKKKEIIVGLCNGTIQIFSHFKNFAEYIIYDLDTAGKNKENKRINKMYFSKLNSILYVGRAEKDIYVYQMPENYNSENGRRIQDSNSYGILDGSKICKNAIDTGHPKTTEVLKTKSFMDKLK
jgi:hypothetical protein